MARYRPPIGQIWRQKVTDWPWNPIRCVSSVAEGQPMDTEQTNLSLEQVAGVLRRRMPWILLCFVLVTAATYGFSKHQTKQYTATASLVFGNNQLGQQVAGLPLASSTSQQAQENTNLKLVKLGDMAAKTAA